MKKLLLIMLSPLFAVGCAETETPEAGAVKYITVTADVPATRGTPVTSVSQIADIGLFCSYTATGKWNAFCIPVLAYNRKMVHSALADVWEFDGNNIEWNASSAADNYTFFAYAPHGTAANGIAMKSTASTPGIPAISYTVPSNVLNQPDLMVAVPKKDLHPTGHPVSLHMKHALVAVGFKVSGSGEKITGINISGIKAYGELTLDGGNIAWTNMQNGAGGYSASIDFDTEKGYFTAGAERNLLTGDGYLMMIPQQLGANALITMALANGANRTFSLDAFMWNAGERVIYNISL